MISWADVICAAAAAAADRLDTADAATRGSYIQSPDVHCDGIATGKQSDDETWLNDVNLSTQQCCSFNARRRPTCCAGNCDVIDGHVTQDLSRVASLPLCACYDDVITQRRLMSAAASVSTGRSRTAAVTSHKGWTIVQRKFDFTRLAESALLDDFEVVCSRVQSAASATSLMASHLDDAVAAAAAKESSRKTLNPSLTPRSDVAYLEPILKPVGKARRRVSSTQYICGFCERQFTKSYNLKIHVRTHTDERPFICTTCAKAFRRKDHLRDHKYIHYKNKPFQCSLCSKSFCQSRSLALHKATHIDIVSV